jgi:hypothetical protein
MLCMCVSVRVRAGEGRTALRVGLP